MALFREDGKLSVDPRSPGRSYLALARLIPWLRPRGRSDASVDARFYTSRPGQNTLEIRAVSTLFNLTWILLICGAASHLFEIGPLLAIPLFALASLVAVLIIVTITALGQLVTVLLARVGWTPERVVIQSALHQVILVVACIEAALDSHWVRWVGLVWLGLVAMETGARMIEMIRAGSGGAKSES